MRFVTEKAIEQLQDMAKFAANGDKEAARRLVEGAENPLQELLESSKRLAVVQEANFRTATCDLIALDEPKTFVVNDRGIKTLLRISAPGDIPGFETFFDDDHNVSLFTLLEADDIRCGLFCEVRNSAARKDELKNILDAHHNLLKAKGEYFGYMDVDHDGKGLSVVGFEATPIPIDAENDDIVNFIHKTMEDLTTPLFALLGFVVSAIHKQMDANIDAYMQTPEFQEKLARAEADIRAGRCYTQEEVDAYVLGHTHKESPEGKEDQPTAP